MKSKSLEKYLLNKYKLERIEELNLEDVDELILNNIDDTRKTDYDFKDFEEFNNLKYISLQNFRIKNFETNELSRCKKLSAIQFSNCIFKSKSRLKGSIKVISINNCKGFNLNYLSLLKNLEVLKISNLSRINLQDINIYLKNLEKVHLENLKIYHVFNLTKLNQLESLELINCKWNKNMARFFSKNVKIEE